MDANKILITVESLINRPIESVWDYFTKPEHITHWNFASDDWHSPYIVNDLREGGLFSYRMEAKDQSFGFDFSGKYLKVQKPNLVSFVLDDNRRVDVTFEHLNGGTRIVEVFEAESQNSLDKQRVGWQAILDNLKKYAESL